MDFKYETFYIKRLEHKFALFYCVGRSASCPETTACAQKSPFSACGTEVMQQCYESFDPTSESRAATRGDLQTAKTRGQCNKSLLSFSQKSDHWKANKCVSHVFSSQKLNFAKLAPSMRPNSFCSVLAKVFLHKARYWSTLACHLRTLLYAKPFWHFWSARYFNQKVSVVYTISDSLSHLVDTFG